VLVAEPPLLSPALWTTLATGFPPSEHGVAGFHLPDPRGGGPVLAASYHRRRPTIWQIASDAGRTAGIVGWWTTWPAEAVRGYLVSDHLAYNRWNAWAPRSGPTDQALTWPDDLAAELVPLAVPPVAVTPETIASLVPFNSQERQEMMEAKAPVQFHAPSVYRGGYATDVSNFAFARYLLDTRPQPDLFTITFILTDVASHVFWHHREPERYPVAIDGHLREAIPNTYALLDRWTCELTRRLEKDTLVLLVSDHGFRASGHVPQPEQNASGDHAPEGILVAVGPHVAPGSDLGEWAGIDLTPTVLAALAIPIARDMPGRSIDTIVPAGAWRPEAIASYGEQRPELPAEVESEAGDELRERLRSLGYID
jgi:predicted AlkP superfamily phosphohydrolase/phosphomutase